MAMRRRAGVLITGIVLCIAATVWQIPLLRMEWELYRFFKHPQNHANVASEVGSQAAVADEEAADMIESLMTAPEVNELARLVLKYPDNELFIGQLTERLAGEENIDPRAVSVLADRLVRIDTDNGHSHYLRASALLRTGGKAAFDEAVPEIEKGNNAPQFRFACDKYRQRIRRLLGDSRVADLQMYLIGSSEVSLYKPIGNQLRDEGRDALRNSNITYARRLTDAGMVVGERLLERDTGVGELGVGSLLVHSMSKLRLRQPQLSPEEATQARLELARSMAIRGMVDDIAGGRRRELSEVGTSGAIAAVSASFLFYAVLCWLPAFVIMLLRRQSPEARVGVVGHILFIASLAYYLGIAYLLTSAKRGDAPFPMDLPDRLHWAALILPPILWLALCYMGRLPAYDRSRLYRFRPHKTVVCAFIWAAMLLVMVTVGVPACDDNHADWVFPITIWTAFCAASWLVLVYGWFLLRMLPYRLLSGSRALQLLLVATFIAGLSGLVTDLRLLFWLTPVVMICSCIILLHQPTGRTPRLIDAVMRIAGKGENISITRARIVHLLAPYIVVFWALLLASNHVCAHKLSNVIGNMLQSRGELPRADYSIYRAIVSRIDLDDAGEDPSMRGVRRADAISYIPVAGPNELPGILEKLKGAKVPIRDGELLRIVPFCGWDVQGILLNAIEEPEADRALIERAELGDARVKKKLEELFDRELDAVGAHNEEPTAGCTWIEDSWNGHLRKCSGAATALANISGPNEAKLRILAILAAMNESDLKQDEFSSRSYRFYDSLKRLPRPQGTEVLKVYLEKTDYYDVEAKWDPDGLAGALALYADAEMANEIFERTVHGPLVYDLAVDLGIPIHFVGVPSEFEDELTRPRDIRPGIWMAIGPYMENSSIDLLREQLTTDDPVLLAYVVQQLTRLEYQWPQSHIQKLLSHVNWKVRLNALFAADDQEVRMAGNDENPLVRLIAALVAEEH